MNKANLTLVIISAVLLVIVISQHIEIKKLRLRVAMQEKVLETFRTAKLAVDRIREVGKLRKQ